MKQFSKDLGNVSLAPKGKWSREQEYERLALVYNTCDNLSYVAKINVPSGVDIENREYWQPMNATGYADNNFINLTTENENGTITAYETLEEAVATILPINRRAGATLSFYNLNSDRLDRQAEFELWQFNSTDLVNWENKDYWNNIYYNWNVFVGWYIGADALKNHVKLPNVGQYAYVGSNLNDAVLYQCRTNGIWTNTGIKVRNYISVVVSGNITIGENGNWFSDGEDTGIPATPVVDEQLDNISLQLQQYSTEIDNLQNQIINNTTEIDKLKNQDVVLKSNIDSNFETINNKVDNIKTATDNKIDTADANLQNQITNNTTEINKLNAKHESLSKTVQDGIDELQSSKFDKTSILQELGEAEDKVISQKVVSTKLSDLSEKISYPYGNVHLVGGGESFIWSNKISVIQGNKYRIYVDKNININGIGTGIRFIVNSNKSFDNALVLKAHADSLEDYYDVVATSNTLFIGCRAAIGSVFSVYIFDITIQSSNKDNIENQEVKLQSIEERIGSFFVVSLVENILISPDGSTAQEPSTYWGTTDFISVNEGDYISFTGGGRNNCLAVSAYSSKSQDSILTNSSASKAYSFATDAVETIQIVVPTGVKFIRICKDRRVLSGNEIKVLKNDLKSRLDSLDKEIEGIRKDVNTPRIYKYLYRMYSTDTRISTDWTRNADNIYSNGKLGLSNKLMFDYQFALSDRIFTFDFSVEAGSKCHFCSWNANKNIIGTDIIVDALNGNITLKGDGKPDIVETATIVSSHKFRLIIDRSSRLIKISLIDLLDYTKLCEFTTPNDARYYGYFNDKPMCYVESGNICLYNLIVDYHHNQSNKYKLVIYGDSITEGYEAENYTNGYAYRIANAVGNDRVKISARSSGTIENILARIDNELSNIRTDYIMVTIGTNGGNTIENLTQLINKIKEYGAIPIINHIPCDYYNTTQGIDEEELYLSRNRTIDEAILANGGNIDCVRMDVATSKDHIPANGANRSLFKDSIHPTDEGHELIFKQALIDCPYLFN